MKLPDRQGRSRRMRRGLLAHYSSLLVGSRDTSVEVDFNLSSRVMSRESRTVSESILSYLDSTDNLSINMFLFLFDDFCLANYK
jgi:hypothetical protein